MKWWESQLNDIIAEFSAAVNPRLFMWLWAPRSTKLWLRCLNAAARELIRALADGDELRIGGEDESPVATDG